MPMSDFIAILKSEISKFCIPILAIQKKNLCMVHQGSSTPFGKVLHTSPNFYTCIFLMIWILACILLENDRKKLILGEKSTSKFYIAIHKNKSPCFIQKIRLKVSFRKLYPVLEKNNKIWWHKQFHNGLKCHVATYCHKKCHGCQRPWTIELISSVLQLSL